MHTPYTSNFVDAYNTAQTCISVAVSAVLWHQRGRSLASRVVMQAAIGLAAVAPLLGEFEAGIGMHPSPLLFVSTLRWIAALATLATLLAGRWGPLIWAVAGEGLLYFLTGYLTESNFELLSLHLAWCGLLVGLHRLPPATTRHDELALLSRRYLGDWVLFGLATALAALVGSVVLQRMIGSSDEWAYTYQAAVFAKLRAYAPAPACTPAFQNFWVFPYMGKQFSQYTPGWAYFMAPFVWIGAPWVAGSFALGVLVVGIARLSRRAMAMADEGATHAEIRAAGVCAAIATTASSTFLINGGSRFSHVFVLANFVWSLEALLAIATPSSRPSRPRYWAAVLGACAALLLATRPVDGAGLGVGLFVYYVYALVRRRLSLAIVASTAIPFALIGGLTLVILRLQLGKWFATGYSLTAMMHPWLNFELSAPKPDEWRWGFPLATGSYGWWPCSFAVGLAGLASLGRRARPLNWILLLSLTPVLLVYEWVNQARGVDWGYGPRYQMVLTVPMALGTGVALARLYASARARWSNRSALAAGGPFAAALLAGILGVVRTAPLVYPFNYTVVFNQNRLHRTIHEQGIHNALVLVSPGTAGVDPLDLTQNLPLDLYPNQDVIVAITRTPALEQCARDSYPNRAVYRAIGTTQVTLRREL